MSHHRLLVSLAVVACTCAALTARPAAAQPAATADPAAGATSAAIVSPAPADEAAATPAWNEQIFVTANRGERVAEEVPLHVTVLDPLAIAAATDLTASELVSHAVPSFNLQVATSSLVSAPRDQSLSFRGVGGGSVSHALLLVDGLPMLDPYNASAIWSKVPMERIERVEVVPGGGATVWGNLALSGVVNLITRAPADHAFDFTSRVAEHSTIAATASASDLVGRWSGWASLDHLSTDGYYVQDEATRGAAEEREFRDYSSLSVQVGYTLSPAASIQLRALGYDEERGEGSAFDYAENEEWMVALTADGVSGAQSGWELRLFGRRQSLDDYTGTFSADGDTVVPSSYIFDLGSENVGGSAVWNRMPSGRHELSAGADYQYLSVDRHEDLQWDGQRFTERYVVDGDQQLAGGFVESRWRPSERWSWQAGARFDAVRTEGGRSRRTSLVDGTALEDEDLGANTEETVNPSVGFAFQATPASRLRGAAYSGFRSPVPSELFVGSAPRNNRETVANPALGPETLIGAELGWDLSPSSRFHARITAFWSETDDLIQRITVGRVGPEGGVVEPCGAVGPRGACQQRQNLGTTHAYGTELDGQIRLHPRWRVDFAAAWLSTEITDNPAAPELVGNELEHTPGEKFTLGLVYDDARRLSAALRLRHLGERWTEAENENRLDASTLLDLTLAHRLSARLELFGGVENLLDETYRVDFGSEGFAFGPGRIVQAGIRYRAGG